jgi:hypothetical protein
LRLHRDLKKKKNCKDIIHGGYIKANIQSAVFSASGSASKAGN